MSFNEEVASRHQQVAAVIDEMLQLDEPYIYAVFARLHATWFASGLPSTSDVYRLSAEQAERFGGEFDRRCRVAKQRLDSGRGI